MPYAQLGSLIVVFCTFTVLVILSLLKFTFLEEKKPRGFKLVYPLFTRIRQRY